LPRRLRRLATTVEGSLPPEKGTGMRDRTDFRLSLERRRLDRLKRSLVELRLQRALNRLGRAVRAWNPDQPRVPAGNPDGGQWTDRGAQTADSDGRLAANDGTPGSNAAQNS